MLRKKLQYGLLPLLLATLVACVGTIHGGGVVYFFEVNTGFGTGQPTSASIAVSVSCNDARDMVRSTFHITDNTNGANFTSALPWVPVSVFDGVATCEEAAAIVEDQGFSVTFGLLSDQGQTSGEMIAAVTQKGVFSECGPDESQIVVLEAYGTDEVLPGGYYAAGGCLYKGNIVFQ